MAEATRLENLLKDVLDFSRPARYELQPAVARADPARIAGGVRRALRRARHPRSRRDLAAAEPVFIDAGHVRRAVDNLVANAIDAMPSGGTLRVSTRLAAARCLSFVAVTVEDTGPGIPEADLGRLFEPFWTTKKMGEGTGLGLPITRKIVEAHGGFITVANRPGGGLAATLWFPYQDDEALAAPPVLGGHGLQSRRRGRRRPVPGLAELRARLLGGGRDAVRGDAERDAGVQPRRLRRLRLLPRTCLRDGR